MRRLIRTRHLSIAAIVSLLVFGAVLGAGVRSYWSWEQVAVGDGMALGVDTGCLFYTFDNQGTAPGFSHQSVEPDAEWIADAYPATWRFAGFSVNSLNSPIKPTGRFKVFIFRVPIWFPLLLLLIAPVRWLIARPANAPAFPVITDAKREA